MSTPLNESRVEIPSQTQSIQIEEVNNQHVRQPSSSLTSKCWNCFTNCLTKIKNTMCLSICRSRRSNNQQEIAYQRVGLEDPDVRVISNSPSSRAIDIHVVTPVIDASMVSASQKMKHVSQPFLHHRELDSKSALDDLKMIQIDLKSPEIFSKGFQEDFSFFSHALGVTEQSKQQLNKLLEQGFSTPFIERTFSEGLKEFKRAWVLAQEMTDIVRETPLSVDKINLQNVIDYQKQWALHYLVKCSKILLSSEQDRLSLSFSEYLWENESTYYRGDGGALVHLYTNLLENNKDFETLFKTPSLSVEIVKPDRFETLIQSACKATETIPYECMPPFSYVTCGPTLVNIEEKIKVTDRKNVFFDISKYLNANPKIPKDQLVKLLTNLAKDKPDFVIGGMLQTGEGVGLFIHYGRDDLLGPLLNFRGNIGAFPEPVVLQNEIIKHIHPRVVIPKVNPQAVQLQASLDAQQLKGLISNVEKSLSILAKSPLRINQHYARLFHMLFTNLKPNAAKNTPAGNYETQICCYALKKLHTLLNTMVDSSSFDDCLLLAYQGIEEIVDLIHFWGPGGQIKIPELYETSIKGNPHISHQTLLFSSGMAAIDYAFEVLFQLTKDPKITFLSASYYELTQDHAFRAYLQNRAEVSVLSPKETVESAHEKNIIFLDLYPNFATMLSVQRNPVEDIIRAGLKARTKANPLTLILDLSTGALKDKEVNQLIGSCQKEIESGVVQFILLNSLAKFSMSGLDKYTGGLIQCICATNNSHMIEHLKQSSLRDQRSTQATQMYQLLLQPPAIDLMTHYWEGCLENTNQLYDGLRSLTNPKSLVMIAERDRHIPMIGIHFKNFLDQIEPKKEVVISISSKDSKVNNYEKNDLDEKEETPTDSLPQLILLMQYYVYALAKKEGLPLLIRGSFGFPHSAIVECHTALRLTLGALEEVKSLGRYINLFTNMEKDLVGYIGKGKNKKELLDLISRSENLEFLEDGQAKIINLFSKSGNPSFEEFIRIVLANKPVDDDSPRVEADLD